MHGKLLYDSIVLNLHNNPTDIATIPSNSRDPLWFTAYIDGGDLYVKGSVNKKPACQISKPRKINFNDFMTVYGYYHRWANGDRSVRQEVRTLSRNTAYVFALINKYHEAAVR